MIWKTRVNLKFKLATIEVTSCVAVLHIVSVWFGNQLIIQGAAGKYQVAQEKTQHDLDKAHQVNCACAAFYTLETVFPCFHNLCRPFCSDIQTFVEMVA